MSFRQRAFAIPSCAVAVLVAACGATAEEPRQPDRARASTENEAPSPGPTADLTTDDGAREAAARAFREVAAPRLRPERAAVADRWEADLAQAEGGLVTRGPCADQAAGLRDSIDSLGTPDSAQQQVLYGAPEDLDAGDCVTVQVGIGFETLVIAMRRSDGQLLLVWDVPEG